MSTLGTPWNTRTALSPLYCPIPHVTPHPAFDEVKQRCITWLNEYGILDDPEHRKRVLGTEAAYMTCLWAPNGTVDLLSVSAQWVYLGFAIDDARFDDGPIRGRADLFLPMIMDVLQGLDYPEGATTDDPYVAAFQDLGRRVREVSEPEVARRWVEGNHAWFFGASAMVAHRQGGTLPTLESYMNIGPRDRGIRTCVAAIEVAEGTGIPAAELDTPAMRAAFQAASLTVTLSNDLFSYRREVEQEALESNIINIIAHQHNVLVEVATEQALRLRERFLALYLALRDQMLPQVGERSVRYLRQLDRFVRGDAQWSAEVPRYRGGTLGTEPVELDGEFRDVPLEPPFPAVAWMWAPLGCP